MFRWFNKGLLIGVAWLGLAAQVFAADFDCSFRLIKSSCWQGKKITLKVINSDNLQTETMHILSEDAEVLEAPIDCEKIKSLTFKASVSPPVWEGDKGRFYSSRRLWNVPSSLPGNADRWYIDICFSRDFSGVPDPVVDFTRCECVFPKRIERYL